MRSRPKLHQKEIRYSGSSKAREGGPSFSFGNRVERLIWSIAWLFLARWTPANLSRWRIVLLKLFGAQIDVGASISNSAKVWLPRNLILRRHSTVGPRVDCYNMATIEIGEHAVISQGAVLCGGTHDIEDPDFQLIAQPIIIEEHVWVAAEAFVGPRVTIGSGAVLGARACTFRSLEPWTVYVGNPAKPIKRRRWRDAHIREPAKTE
jgi:putative colanic acid biosynthesis acetyltransferase WcaF